MNNLSCNYRLLFLSGFLFSFVSLLSAQDSGRWRNHFSYHNTTQIVETHNKVFAVANGSLYSYSPEDQEVKQYNKFDGLNDTDIKFLAYSEEEKALLIVYSNGNIDIFTNSDIYNLPFVIDKSYQDKTINGVDMFGRTAYISTAFGLVEIDMQKKEIPNTYLVGNIRSACEKDDYIYIATTGGVLRGLKSRNLNDRNNWEEYTLNISGVDNRNINKILLFQEAFIFCQYNRGLFYKTESGTGVLQYNNTYKRVCIINNQLVAVANSNVDFWSDLESKTTLTGINIQDIASRGQNRYWIAKGEEGLAAIKKETSSNEYSVLQSDIKMNTPNNNHSYHVSFQGNKLYVVGGGGFLDRFGIEGTIKILDDDKWSCIDKKEIDQYLGTRNEVRNKSFRDVLRLIVDPRDPTRFYASAFGEGLYEFRNEKIENLYNTKNSPFENVNPAVISTRDENNYVRLGGLAYDSRNNLYISAASEGYSSVLYALTHDNQWVRYPYWRESRYFSPVEAIAVTSYGAKWLGSKRQGLLYILEDNGTIADFSDDKTVSYSSFSNQQGDRLTFGALNCIIEDKKKAIWVGTDRGPLVFYNPQNAIKDPDRFYYTQPLVPINDGSGLGKYLLETDNIKGIAVDGANRKWLATERSGVFLVSEDGTHVLLNFTEENSPLPTNNVNSIAINDNTGEVFFATEAGLVSYMGNASEGKADYSEVQVYPNPVRPEYDDMVTISNLVQDSNVRITDVKGNLVYQGLSKGGMFSWRCINRDGSRVKTGIYLVFAARPDGSEGVVTKIMVVK